jgi:hypothetical protein
MLSSSLSAVHPEIKDNLGCSGFTNLFSWLDQENPFCETCPCLLPVITEATISKNQKNSNNNNDILPVLEV